MAEAEQDGTDRRNLVAAFMKEVRGDGSGPSKVVPRAWAVGLTVLVVGAGAVGVGMLTGRDDHRAPAGAAGPATSTGTSAPTGAKEPEPPSPGTPGTSAPPPAGTGPAGAAVTAPPRPAPAAPTAGTAASLPPAPAVTAPSAPAALAPLPPVPAGAAPSSPAPLPPAPPAAAPSSGAPAPAGAAALKSAVYTAVAGYGCANSGTQSFSEAGRNVDGRVGWVSVGSGGWAQDGCNGQFDTMPMSGAADKDDKSNYALWTFSPGAAGLRTATCQVETYVPDDKDITHVGGNPAHYESYTSAGPSSPMLNSFDVSQPGHLGEWKPVGTFRTTTGVLTIKLDSRGVDWHGSTKTNAHLAVAQMRATCS
ncbi:hypothetical protein ACFCX4_25030 [Kitasatospora sp. NPDC056327]|uniref:hypothetical protein n=1 Tax=Kitasatospora sp. NPDC056327 TaxID=3345785 RepID=UPI0035E28A2B